MDGMHNHILAMKAADKDVRTRIANDFCFDKQETIYILTEPNKIGKCIYCSPSTSRRYWHSLGCKAHETSEDQSGRGGLLHFV